MRSLTFGSVAVAVKIAGVSIASGSDVVVVVVVVEEVVEVVVEVVVEARVAAVCVCVCV